jgi:hypothetical protein
MMLSHPWVWLNEPQHAAAIQAVASLVATIAAVVAGIFAGKAFYATARQLNIAKEQLTLQRDQFEAEKLRLLEERYAEKSRAKATYDRIKSEEDAERPRFRNGGFTPSNFQSMEFTNYGITAASDVSFIPTKDTLPVTHFDIIQPDGRVTFQVDMEAFRTTGIMVRFRTRFGSAWEVLLTLPTNSPLREDVRKVIRNYGPPEGVIEGSS